MRFLQKDSGCLCVYGIGISADSRTHACEKQSGFNTEMFNKEGYRILYNACFNAAAACMDRSDCMTATMGHKYGQTIGDENTDGAIGTADHERIAGRFRDGRQWLIRNMQNPGTMDLPGETQIIGFQSHVMTQNGSIPPDTQRRIAGPVTEIQRFIGCRTVPSGTGGDSMRCGDVRELQKGIHGRRFSYFDFNIKG